MAFLGIGTKSTSGIICDPSTTFINVSARENVIDISDPMRSDFAHYLVYDFLQRNHFRHHRHIDNSIELERDHAQSFVAFARARQVELDELVTMVTEVDQTESHATGVDDPLKFDEHLQKVIVHKSNIEKADRYIDSLKVQLYQATGTSQGIDGVTKATISSTTAFSEAQAKKRFPKQHATCIDIGTERKLDVKYKRTYTLEARKFTAPTIDNLDDRIKATRLIRLIHEDYYRHQNIIDRSKNLLDVEEMYLKLAIGRAGSMRGVFSYKTTTTMKLKTTDFRTKHKELYEACKVTSEAKWKCEILPFRG
jgi:hypothetical protein